MKTDEIAKIVGEVLKRLETQGVALGGAAPAACAGVRWIPRSRRPSAQKAFRTSG